MEHKGESSLSETGTDKPTDTATDGIEPSTEEKGQRSQGKG